MSDERDLELELKLELRVIRLVREHLLRLPLESRRRVLSYVQDVVLGDVGDVEMADG